MVWRLVRDFTRRSASHGLKWAGLVALSWPALGGMFSLSSAMAASMAAALLAGPVTVYRSRLAAREVRLLPASARQIWVAQWFVSTIVATSWTTIPKAVETAVARGIGLDAPGVAAVMLSAACDFAFVGTCVALLPLADWKPRGPRAFRVAWIAIRMSAPALVLAAVYAMRSQLPQRWDDLAGPAGVVLVVALAVTVAGYRYTPAPGSRWRVVARSTEAAADAPSPGHGVVLNRFSGLGYLVWREAAVWSIGMLAYLGLMYALIVLGNARAGGGPPPAEIFGREFGPGAAGTFPFYYFGWMPAVLVACLLGAVKPSLRHLRVLPISTPGAVGVLMARPAARVGAIWGTAAIVFLATTGGIPAALRGDVFVWFAGLVALAHSVQLRGPRSNRFGLAWLMVTGAVVASALATFDVLQLVEQFARALLLTGPALLGAGALAAAALVNWYTLTRGHDAYRAGDDAVRALRGVP